MPTVKIKRTDRRIGVPSFHQPPSSKSQPRNFMRPPLFQFCNQDLDDLPGLLLDGFVQAIGPEPLADSLLRGAGLEVDGGDDEVLWLTEPLPAVGFDRA